MCECVLSTKSDLKIHIRILFALQVRLFIWSALCSMFHFPLSCSLSTTMTTLEKKFFNRLLKRAWGIIIIIFCVDTQESTHFNYHDIYLLDIRSKTFRRGREWCQKKRGTGIESEWGEKKEADRFNQQNVNIYHLCQANSARCTHYNLFSFCLSSKSLSHSHSLSLPSFNWKPGWHFDGLINLPIRVAKE